MAKGKSASAHPALLVALASTTILAANVILLTGFLRTPQPVADPAVTVYASGPDSPGVLAASTTATRRTLSGPPPAGLTSATVSTPKGSFRATIMSLDGVRMLTDSASDSECKNDCPTLSLKDFVTRNGGFAGVNGTYFCPATYGECGSKKNSFDFPVFNSRLKKWMSQDSLSWGGRSLLFQDGGGFQYRQDSSGYPGSPSSAVINYPGLVNDGNIQIDDNQSGLSGKQKAKGTKVGIGTRGGTNVMVVVAYGVNMQEFAHVFKTLGAKGALNLDSGGSTALYYNGRYVLGPGRGLPNAIVFAR